MRSLFHKIAYMKNYKITNREDFMRFFRDNEKMNDLTPDDRVEVFRTILIGSSDFTKELLEDILTDYSVTNLKVISLKDGE